MSAPAEDLEPEGTEVTDPAEESDGMSEHTAKAVLLIIAFGALAGVVVAFPYVAYFMTGILACLAWQKVRARLGKRRDDDAERDQEAAPPDVGEALRRLVGDDKGVLLTVLRDDLKLPSTKAVKALLKAAGIPWKAVRTREGNGPAVHRDAVPPAPSPAAADSHGDGCCCRSGNNANANNSGEGEGKEGLRVERTDTGFTVYDLVDRFFAEAARNHPPGSPGTTRGEVSDR